MNPPPHVESVYLKKNGTNNFEIYFSTSVKDAKKINSYLKDESFITEALKLGSLYSFESKKETNEIFLNKIKPISIKGSNYQKGKTDFFDLKLKYEITNKTETTINYKINGKKFFKDELESTFNDITMFVKLENNRLYLSMKYTDNNENLNNFQKYQMAHFLRNSLVPYKKEISS